MQRGLMKGACLSTCRHGDHSAPSEYFHILVTSKRLLNMLGLSHRRVVVEQTTSLYMLTMVSLSFMRS